MTHTNRFYALASVLVPLFVLVACGGPPEVFSPPDGPTSGGSGPDGTGGTGGSGPQFDFDGGDGQAAGAGARRAAALMTMARPVATACRTIRRRVMTATPNRATVVTAFAR